MKRFLILLGLTIALSSCEREVIEIVDTVNLIPESSHCQYDHAPIYHGGGMAHGRISGIKNCLPFQASSIAYIDQYLGQWAIGIYFNTYELWYGFFFADKEHVSVGAVLPAITTQKSIYRMYDPIHNRHLGTYSTLQDSDVFEDKFRIDTSHYNWICFDKVDLDSMIVRGHFEVRYILATPPSIHPDTVLFSHCHFHSKLFE